MNAIVWILFVLCCVAMLFDLFLPLRKNKPDETAQIRAWSLVFSALQLYVYSTILFK